MFVLRYNGQNVTSYLADGPYFTSDLQQARTFKSFDELFKAIVLYDSLHKRIEFDGKYELIRVRRGVLQETGSVL